jgi:hypothetical protein
MPDVRADASPSGHPQPNRTARAAPDCTTTRPFTTTEVTWLAGTAAAAAALIAARELLGADLLQVRETPTRW